MEKKKLITYIVLMIFIMLFLNSFSGYVSDDYFFGDGVNLFDIIEKEYTHYLVWSGRSIGSIIARLFMMAPKILFNIANSIAYVLFTYLIYKHCNIGKPTNSKLYLLICCCLFLFWMTFGDSVLWLTGSCTYTWLGCFMLGFCLIYRSSMIANSSIKNSPLLLGSAVILGILSGWSVENTGGMALLFIVCTLIYNKVILKENIKLWQIVGLVSCVIGFLILLLSPGSTLRLERILAGTPSFLNQYLNNTTSLSDMFFIFMRISAKATLIFILLFPISIVYLTNIIVYTRKSRTIPWMIIIYAFVGIAGIYSLMLSPSHPPRAFFIPGVFIVAAIAQIYLWFEENQIVTNWIANTTKITIIFSIVIMSVVAIPDIISSYIKLINRENYIEDQLSVGNNSMVLPEVFSYTWYSVVTTPPADHDIKPLSLYYKIEVLETLEYYEWLKHIQE